MHLSRPIPVDTRHCSSRDNSILCPWMHTCSRQPGGRSRGDLRLTGLAAVSGPAGRWQAQKKWTGCSQKPRRARRGLGCLRSTSAPTKDPLQGRTTRPRARRSSSRAPPDPPPTPPTPQPRPTPRGPRKPHHPAACPIAAPSQMPMHSPTTAPTKLAGPLSAATKPHQTPQQLLAARGHVLGAAGASGAAEGPQQQRLRRRPPRAPPLPA